MQLSTFYDKKVHKIDKDSEDYETLYNTMLELEDGNHYSEPIYVFPNNPVLKEINHEYLMSPYIKGEYAKIMLVTIDNVQRSIVWLNGDDAYEPVLSFHKDLFKGTFWKGQIVNVNKGTYNLNVFYINDLLYYKGIPFFDQSLSTKIQTSYDTLKFEYFYDDLLNPLYIRLRPYLLFYQYHFMKEHNCKNILFYHEYSDPIKRVFCVSIPQDDNNELKEKVEKGASTTFLLKEHHKDDFDTFYCLLDDKGKEVQVFVAQTLKQKKKIKSFLNKQVKCTFNDITKQWLLTL